MRIKAIAGFLFLLGFLCGSLIQAQQFGGTPTSVKWRQINTDTVRVIFPKDLQAAGERVENITQNLQKHYSNTIGNKIRKVNIVLHNNATLSNGYVGLGPYRSEFYLMPPQNAFELGAQNWLDNLSIHEFRHVQQYSNFRKGLSKTFSVLFGENGQALANAASIPDWFFEGDAVYNETLLSEQGRGRLPAFFNGFRSLYFAGSKYSYMKLRNGSFKDYTPDHYQLGYLLVAYGREKYGMDFWRKVTSDAVAFKPLFYPFQHALKKHADISFNEFVHNSFDFYQDQWRKEKSDVPNWLTGESANNVVSYRYPYAAEDGALIVLKTSYRTIPAFYKIDSQGNQTKLGVRDIAYDNYFSYNNNRIVYAAYQPDIRWDNRDYSIIKTLDLNTGKEKRITTHTKYFSPDISHDGNSIAAVRINETQHSGIDILNNSGQLIKTLMLPDTLIYSYPKFSTDDQSVIFIVRNNPGEMSLQKTRIADDHTETLLPFANRILGFPTIQGDTILYSCSNEGRDEIWAFVSSSNKNFRLANFRTGLYQAALGSGNQLTASAFTSKGYRLGNFTPSWQPVEKEAELSNLYVTRLFDTIANKTLAETQHRNFPVAVYPKLFHPFNFHSWRPDYNDPDYSFIIYGENVLNTLQSQLYYTYNRNEGFSKVGYNLAFGGWYIQPIGSVSETFQRKIAVKPDSAFYFNEFTASAGLQLPLNLSGGKQYRNLSLSTTFNIDQVHWTGESKKLFYNIGFNYLESRLFYSGQNQKAVQQIYPHWAQTLLLQYRTITHKYTGNQFLASGNLYLPGFFSTNSIVLNAAWQSRDTVNQYSFSNNFPFSRGYVVFDYPQMWKLGANYHFPLFYPDWGFGNMVYFQRIRANAFYDYTQIKSLKTSNQYQFRTIGAEIYFDTKWWNQQPVTFGIRYNHLQDHFLTGQKQGMWEIILPLNLLN